MLHNHIKYIYRKKKDPEGAINYVITDLCTKLTSPETAIKVVQNIQIRKRFLNRGLKRPPHILVQQSQKRSELRGGVLCQHICEEHVQHWTENHRHPWNSTGTITIISKSRQWSNNCIEDKEEILTLQWGDYVQYDMKRILKGSILRNANSLLTKSRKPRNSPVWLTRKWIRWHDRRNR